MDLNPTRIVTRRMLASPHVTHALVEGAVSAGILEHVSPGEGRTLWRLDRGSGGHLTLYVSSAVEPDFRGVGEQAGWVGRPSWRTAAYGVLLDRLAPGQRWRFRLTANPTTSAATPNGRGQRRPLRTVDQQMGWLLQRTEVMGISVPYNGLGVPQLTLAERGTVSFRKAEDGAGPRSLRRVELTTATYEGLLVVDDPVRVRRALIDGVGRAKGYGCGLITLAPEG